MSEVPKYSMRCECGAEHTSETDPMGEIIRDAYSEGYSAGFEACNLKGAADYKGDRICEEECPKCSSEDVSGQYREPGTYGAPLDARLRENEYIKQSSLVLTSKKEHIALRCGFCKYEWEVTPLEEL